MSSIDHPLAHRVTAALERPASALWFAPCRVNLIGDHIDYVGGTVLPMSIDRGTLFAACPTAGSAVEVRALDEGSRVEIELDPHAADQPRRRGNAAAGWIRFVDGLLALGARAEGPGRGLRVAVAGETRGGGLSSSASFCVGLARVLVDMGILAPMDELALARLAQRVEHEFVGVQCGLMDQLSVVCGRDDGAIALDCATGHWRSVPLDWGDRVLLAALSPAPRELASGGYNRRRAELAEGLERIGTAPDRVPDASLLEGDARTDVPARRVRHVISEQQRVHAALAAAAARDWEGFGRLLSASHSSLRDDYEVSIDDVDRMVEAALATPGCAGARMTGGGFGGWVIALVETGAVDAVRRNMDATRTVPLTDETCFVARPGGAVRMLGGGDANG